MATTLDGYDAWSDADATRSEGTVGLEDPGAREVFGGFEGSVQIPRVASLNIHIRYVKRKADGLGCGFYMGVDQDGSGIR